MTSPDIPVSGGAEFLWQLVVASGGTRRGPGLNDALIVLFTSYREMCLQVGQIEDARTVEDSASTALANGEHGMELTTESVMKEAAVVAGRRDAKRVYERDVVAVLLAMAGVALRPEEPDNGSVCAPRHEADAATDAPEAGTAGDPTRRTPNLDKLARDLTREAADGLIGDVVGRDAETQSVVETLLRDSKRNPLLIGPAGVGKTAIIEGLALRVVRGEVPDALRNARVFAIQVTDLVQGMGHVGDFEERMNKIIREAEQDGVVLFLDEIHAAVGAGSGSAGHNDLANILKPALARGKMACIGATTDSEYDRFITVDPAFERRFQPLRVQEPPRTATLNILQRRGKSAFAKFGVDLSPEALDTMISLAERFMRNRYMPDKAIDVFDQTLARARLKDMKSVTPELVRDVVGAMVGMPIDGEALAKRLDGLAQILMERGGCQPDSAVRIAQRLQVTMRGMDVRPLRPDVIIMAVSDRQDPAVLARALSDGLFGDDSPIIEMDMSSFVHPADVNWLVGAPPGYVGHDQTPPLHLLLAQRPWSVVVFKRPDLAHAAVQSALAAILRDGFLRDSKGRHIHLSDAVVVLTAMSGTAARPVRVGFGAEAGTAAVMPEGAVDPAKWLDAELAACVDMTCRISGGAAVTEDWVMGCLLGPLAKRWSEDRNVKVEWGREVAARIVGLAAQGNIDRGGAERLFEDEVAPAIASLSVSLPAGARVAVQVSGDRVVARRIDDD